MFDPSRIRLGCEAHGVWSDLKEVMRATSRYPAKGVGTAIRMDEDIRLRSQSNGEAITKSCTCQSTSYPRGDDEQCTEIQLERRLSCRQARLGGRQRW